MSLVVSLINIARLKPGVRKQYIAVAVSKPWLQHATKGHATLSQDSSQKL